MFSLPPCQEWITSISVTPRKKAVHSPDRAALNAAVSTPPSPLQLLLHRRGFGIVSGTKILHNAPRWLHNGQAFVYGNMFYHSGT